MTKAEFDLHDAFADWYYEFTEKDVRSYEEAFFDMVDLVDYLICRNEELEGQIEELEGQLDDMKKEDVTE